MKTVADGSKKVTALMVELREQDSMINSDWDDSDDDEEHHHRPSSLGDESSDKKRTLGLKNSLIDLGDTLLRLAKCSERPPGAKVPRVTLRITRIPSDCDIDDRIQQTFSHLRSKGIHLVFGDLSDVPLTSLPHPLPTMNVRPGRKICLDPTALMALCSDLLHYPLPESREDALKRFFRPRETLQDLPSGRHANGPGRGGEVEEAEKERWRGQSQNSRELVKNLLEEMEAPLIDYLRDTLASSTNTAGRVEWWTTREAVQYLQEILGSEEVVGDGMEQTRMRRLVGLDSGDFFEGSRYANQAGPLVPLRVKIFDHDDLENQPPPTSFHRSLACVAQSCVDNYHAYEAEGGGLTGDVKPKGQEGQIGQAPFSILKALPNFLKPNRIPTPKVAQISLPFPIVSLITLARGAKEGMTTMMCGNVVFRDLFGQGRWKVPGWVQGNYEVEMGRMSGWGTEGQDGRAINGAGSNGCGGGVRDVDDHTVLDQGGLRQMAVEAAVWMLPYRSLGEGKRVKFQQGDYSYPSY